MRLHVTPEAVLVAYGVCDSPINAVTPLSANFALSVTFAQKHQKDAGVGIVVALMLPESWCSWCFGTLFFAAWYLIGLPWGFRSSADMAMACKSEPGSAHRL
jgi:aminobenzoyl-glutamate transport protein